MEFRLFYRGNLRSNGSPKHKQAIRRILHGQFQVLWEQKPLQKIKNVFLYPKHPPPNDKANNIIRKMESFTFAPLVCESTQWTATLDITLLKREPPGSIVTQSGDIDNRLKTLLDALRIPHDKSELPVGEEPGEGETPFFCLLEDDSLLTSISVTTDRLLGPVASNSEVVLLMKVVTTAHYSIFANYPNL